MRVLIAVAIAFWVAMAIAQCARVHQWRPEVDTSIATSASRRRGPDRCESGAPKPAGVRAARLSHEPSHWHYLQAELHALQQIKRHVPQKARTHRSELRKRSARRVALRNARCDRSACDQLITTTSEMVKKNAAVYRSDLLPRATHNIIINI